MTIRVIIYVRLMQPFDGESNAYNGLLLLTPPPRLRKHGIHQGAFIFTKFFRGTPTFYGSLQG